MTYPLKVVLEVEVDAPSRLDANEIVADIFGSASDFGVSVTSLTVTDRRVRKPK